LGRLRTLGGNMDLNREEFEEIIVDWVNGLDCVAAHVPTYSRLVLTISPPKLVLNGDPNHPSRVKLPTPKQPRRYTLEVDKDFCLVLRNFKGHKRALLVVDLRDPDAFEKLELKITNLRDNLRSKVVFER